MLLSGLFEVGADPLPGPLGNSWVVCRAIAKLAFVRPTLWQKPAANALPAVCLRQLTSRRKKIGPQSDWPHSLLLRDAAALSRAETPSRSNFVLLRCPQAAAWRSPLARKFRFSTAIKPQLERAHTMSMIALNGASAPSSLHPAALPSRLGNFQARALQIFCRFLIRFAQLVDPALVSEL